MTDAAYIKSLGERIGILNENIANFTERRDQLRAEREEALEQWFEAETGLHFGDALEVTQEFVTFENARGNDGNVWRRYVEGYGNALRVSADAENYYKNHEIRVEHGGVSTGGVPVKLVQRMREAWLSKHEEPAHE